MKLGFGLVVGASVMTRLRSSCRDSAVAEMMRYITPIAKTPTRNFCDLVRCQRKPFVEDACEAERSDLEPV